MRLCPVVALMAVAVLLMPDASTAATYKIKAARKAWKPAHRYLAKGDRVTWTNPTSRRHNVVAYGGGWTKNTLLRPNQSTRRRFRRTGLYRYRCTFHSSLNRGRCRGMCGMIHVIRK
jgi:plastocyanin